MQTVVITGVNGFVGAHLVNELQKNNFQVIGVGIEEKENANLEGKLLKYYKSNLVESWPVEDEIFAIIHLAGFSAVGPSYDKPQLYINGNTAMVTNLCEYYVKKNRGPRILIISSGAIYDGKQPMPISENSSLGFTSPYAVSKVAVENQASYYRQRGLDIIIARPFNHIGPGQSAGFLLPDIIEKIRNLPSSKNEILMGNLLTKRDYTDVRDIVRAYVSLITKGKLKQHIYNVCSGQSLSGVEIFDIAKKILGKPDLTWKIDKKLIRPTDIFEIIGDNSQIISEINWTVQNDIEISIQDYINERNISNQ